jgi:ATP-binding cassette subfamily B protein
VQFGLLLTLMIFASIMEAVSVGSVVPFLGGLTNSDGVFSHSFAQPIVRFFQLTDPRQLQLILAISFAAMAIVAGSVRVALLWVNSRLGHAVGSDISINIYRRTLYQPYSVHLARNSSEVIAGISTKSSQIVLGTILPLLTAVSACLILVTVVIALILIDPYVALAAFGGFGAIYVVVLRLTYGRLTTNGQRYNEGVTRVFKVLQEGLGGIRDVLIDGTQEAYCRIYRETDLPFRRADANIAILGNSPRYVIESLGLVLIAILAFVFSGRPGGISDLIPVLGALALGSIRLLSVLQQAYSAWASIRGSSAALQDVLNLLQQPLPEYASLPKAEAMPFLRSIALRGISFRYGPDAPDVLTSVDLTISKGSRVGFVGSTGSGKSTLIDVVMGLLPPTQGALEIDGQTVSEANVRTWQMHIAHVPQSIFLSDASIAENIAFGIPVKDIDIDRVRLAAKQAQISDSIESWSQQYETRVGERGVRLSGGQRQRIGIARALYKRADVIVFDEATSALDTETEKAVMRAIDGLSSDLTVIMIAHRLTTLRGCSHIVELSAGRIKRVCTYTEMMRATPPVLPS